MNLPEHNVQTFRDDEEIHIFKTGYTDAYHGADQTQNIVDPKVLELYLEGRTSFYLEHGDEQWQDV